MEFDLGGFFYKIKAGLDLRSRQRVQRVRDSIAPVPPEINLKVGKPQKISDLVAPSQLRPPLAPDTKQAGPTGIGSDINEISRLPELEIDRGKLNKQNN